MTPKLKEIFLIAVLIAVGNAVTQYLIPVPSVPRMELGEAVARTFDEMVALEEAGCLTETDARLMDVWAAAHNIGWTFWPNDEFGSRRALIDARSLERPAGVMVAYRQAAAQATPEPVPPAAPHWEAVTPPIGGTAP